MPFGRANEAQRGVYDYEAIRQQPEVNERTKRLHKRKKHRTEKLGAERNIKFGYEAKAMFSGAVYFRDALCNDTPGRKEKIGGLFFYKEDGKNSSIYVQVVQPLVWVYKYFAYRPIFFYFRANISVL